jgi:hypothetical protein
VRLGRNSWLNLSKHGASLSGRVGPLTVNSRGRTSVRVGHGVSYRTYGSGCASFTFGVAALAVAALLLGACSSSSSHAASTSTVRHSGASTTAGTAASSTVATTTTVAVVPTTVANLGATTTSIPTTPPKSCSDGSSPALYDPQNGFYATALKTVDAGAGTLRYDVVQWLVGAKAHAQWVHDHPQEPDGPPDDYYVINVSPAIYQSAFAPNVRVFDIADEANPASMQSDTLAAFEAKINAGKNASGVYAGHLFWVRLGGGKITEVCEQWVP